MTTDLSTRLDEDFAEAWRPDTGDKIEGTVESVTSNDAGWGPYPIVTVNTGKTRLAIHGFHTVLKNELARIQPSEGDTIAVKYMGLLTAKDGKTQFHGYRVVTDSETSTAVDWSAIADTAREETQALDNKVNQRAQKAAIERDMVREETGRGKAKKSEAAPTDEIPF